MDTSNQATVKVTPNRIAALEVILGDHTKDAPGPSDYREAENMLAEMREAARSFRLQSVDPSN